LLMTTALPFQQRKHLAVHPAKLVSHRGIASGNDQATPTPRSPHAGRIHKKRTPAAAPPQLRPPHHRAGLPTPHSGHSASTNRRLLSPIGSIYGFPATTVRLSSSNPWPHAGLVSAFPARSEVARPDDSQFPPSRFKPDPASQPVDPSPSRHRLRLAQADRSYEYRPPLVHPQDDEPCQQAAWKAKLLGQRRNR
jgi:hypothetical protein